MRSQAIAWTNAGLLNEQLETKFNDIWNKTLRRKMKRVAEMHLRCRL